MIKKIVSSEIDILDSVIEAYFEYIKEKFNRPKFPLKERLTEGLEKKELEIYSQFSGNEAIGFSVVNLESIGINLFLNYKLINERNINGIDIDLFNHTFERLKSNYESIKYSGPVSESFKEHLTKNDFKIFKRARMGIDKRVLESLNETEPPPGYFFRNYQTSDKLELAKIMSISHFHPDHPDGLIWKNWNGIEGCLDLLTGIENSTYGKFETPLNKVIEKNKQPIGACFITLLANDVGYIPEIVVSEEEKNRGIGKKLLVYSLKEFMKAKPEAPKVDLDVTLNNNNASKLYSTIGFEEINQYSVYVWNASD